MSDDNEGPPADNEEESYKSEGQEGYDGPSYDGPGGYDGPNYDGPGYDGPGYDGGYRGPRGPPFGGPPRGRGFMRGPRYD